MGDAAGIGPEVIVSALEVVAAEAQFKPIVIGDLRRLKQAQKILKTKKKLVSVHSVDSALF